MKRGFIIFLVLLVLIAGCKKEIIPEEPTEEPTVVVGEPTETVVGEKPIVEEEPEQITEEGLTTIEYQLKPGINLIKLPLETNLKANDILDKVEAEVGKYVCRSIFRLKKDKKWESFTKNGVDQGFNIEGGKLYYIYCSQGFEESSFKLSGRLKTEYDFVPGDNEFVALEGVKARTAKELIEEVGCRSIYINGYKFVVKDGKFQTHPKTEKFFFVNGLINNFDIVPGEFYFVNCRDSTTYKI